MRKDEKTITDLKAKGQSPISLEQGEKLARELKYKTVPLFSNFNHKFFFSRCVKYLECSAKEQQVKLF